MIYFFVLAMYVSVVGLILYFNACDVIECRLDKLERRLFNGKTIAEIEKEKQP